MRKDGSGFERRKVSRESRGMTEIRGSRDDLSEPPFLQPSLLLFSPSIEEYPWRRVPSPLLRVLRHMNTLLLDLRHAARALLRAPYVPIVSVRRLARLAEPPSG